MEQFKSWEDMTVLEQARETYWDMYKDAYGHLRIGLHRPLSTKEISYRRRCLEWRRVIMVHFKLAKLRENRDFF